MSFHSSAIIKKKVLKSMFEEKWRMFTVDCVLFYQEDDISGNGT